jgi:alpha-1,3-mannosyl-glycoprotein beta-1,2-N-acetylglucosaminyltransferase
MFGLDGASPPPGPSTGRRFGRARTREGDKEHEGVGAFVRANRLPLCLAAFAFAISFSVFLTWAVACRGAPGTAGLKPTAAAGGVPARQIASAIREASGRRDGLNALDSLVHLLPAAVESELQSLGGLEKGEVTPSPVALATPPPVEQNSVLSPSPKSGTAPSTGEAPRQDVWKDASPSRASALLVICYNRPEYLQRTLETVLARLPRTDRPHVIVSQDGSIRQVGEVIDGMQERFRTLGVSFEHIVHEQSRQAGDDGFGYMALARHFGWALGEAFGRGHPRVIVLEDDLEIGADFFEYFAAVAPLLEADPSLLAASAYNDIGQAAFVSDPSVVYRSDFFPGLGWMLTKRVWEELRPKWPRGYWDDWLREPAQRRGRQILHPQVSRTRTFGKEGVSRSQFFGQYLESIKLNEDSGVDWRHQDLSYLNKASYDRALEKDVSNAVTVSADQALRYQCSGNLRSPSAIKVLYGSVDNYPNVANVFGFIADVKANVPRTAYRGVVMFPHNGCTVYLVPGGGRPLEG